MSVALSSLSKPIRWLLISSSAFFVIYFGWTALHTTVYSYSSVRQLREVFDGISPPPTSHKIDDLHTSSKFTTQSVYENFSSQLTSDATIRYYADLLAVQGWKESESRATFEGGHYSKYCKGDMDVVVETIQPTSGQTRFLLSVNRENGLRESTGCGNRVLSH
jgi:hypothetical protein